jgi:hypothetical protein
MKKTIPLFLLLTTIGCASALTTGLVIFKGTDVKPDCDILLTGDKRVAVVPRSVYSNAYEMQNAPREIARQVNVLLEKNILENHRLNQRNKKLKIVEQSKVETWLDNCNNDFASFVEVGRDKSIKADVVIGIDIIGFRIRDPQNASLTQGRCEVQIQAIDCETGKVEARETLMVVYPPNMPFPLAPNKEQQFRSEFIRVVSERVAALFHYYDKNSIDRFDGDNLGMH